MKSFTLPRVRPRLVPRLLTCLVLSTGLLAHAGLTLYVDAGPAGDNTRDRTQASNPGTPVKTITRALALALTAPAADDSGDTIRVAYGTYDEAVNINNRSKLRVVGVSNSSGQKPLLRDTGQTYTIVQIYNSNNITFDNFEIDGTGAAATSNGITIAPPNTGTPCYNIFILNNKVRDLGEAGIAVRAGDDYTNGCDYLRIAGNEIFRTNYNSRFGSSGISIQAPKKRPTAPTPNSFNAAGTIVIEANLVYNNLISNAAGIQTDCNGIIIDTGGTLGPKVLIQNNVVHNNSGRGIYALSVSNIDILNNTCYQNLRSTSPAADSVFNDRFSDGEFVAVGFAGFPPKNIRMYNNIAHGRFTNRPTYRINSRDNTQLRTDVDVSYNLSYVGSPSFPPGGTTSGGVAYGITSTPGSMITGNPLFVAAITSSSPASSFKVGPTSPSLNKGKPGTQAYRDYDGGALRTSPSDLGAFEY